MQRRLVYVRMQVTASRLRVSPTCDSLFPFISLVAPALLWLLFFCDCFSHNCIPSICSWDPHVCTLLYTVPWEHAIFPRFLISSIPRIHSPMFLVQFLLKSGSHMAKCLKPDFDCVYCPSPRSSSVSVNAY